MGVGVGVWVCGCVCVNDAVACRVCFVLLVVCQMWSSSAVAEVVTHNHGPTRVGLVLKHFSINQTCQHITSPISRTSLTHLPPPLFTPFPSSSVLLSDTDAFGGGGTFFEALGRSSFPEKGGVVVHRGGLRHAGENPRHIQCSDIFTHVLVFEYVRCVYLCVYL